MNSSNLKAIRKSLGLTQQQVASALGLKVAACSKLERGIIQLTVDRLIILSRLFDLSPDEIIFYENNPRGTNKKRERKNVTYIPVAAQAGLFNNFSSQEISEVGVKFFLPVFYEDELYMIHLEGDSMYPTFSNGDYVVVRQLEGDSQIKWGELYLIVTNEGQVIKRVMKSIYSSKILLKSDNELYQPYEIEQSLIRTIWEVKAVISKNLAPRLLRPL